MSKPKPPRHIDELNTSKQAAPRKTGWEPPSPKQVRSSERKMGVLLALSLLAAIGFVAYRKFNDTQNQPPDADQFLAGTETSTDHPPESATDEFPGADGPQPMVFEPPAGGADSNDSPIFVGESTPQELLIAEASIPEQSEPATDPFELQLGTQSRFEPPEGSADPPSEPGGDHGADPFASSSAPTGVTSETLTDLTPEPVDDFGGDPFADSFAAADSTGELPEQPDVPADTVDPFTGATFADSEPADGEPDDTATWSSDGLAPVEIQDPEFETGLATTQPTADAFNAAGDDRPVDEMPALDLFGSDNPAPEQSDEPTPTSDPAASPWGDPVEAGPVAESTPPAMLEPNDPQEMPAITVNPFAAPVGNAEPPALEPQQSFDNPTLDVSQRATTVTEVHDSRGFDAPAGSEFGGPVADHGPFGDGGSNAHADHSPTPHQDPFAPAHDVSHAVNKDEVVIHVVQTGDNFWKISRAHYGSGKFFTALAAYNQSRIPDPRRMRPGMKVLVPGRATLVQHFPQLVSGSHQTPYIAPATGPSGFSIDPSGKPQYRVAKGDTLSQIAQRHLGRSSRWRQLYGMNRDQLPDADSLTTGMVLRLPADATQVDMDNPDFGSR